MWCLKPRQLLQLALRREKKRPSGRRESKCRSNKKQKQQQQEKKKKKKSSEWGELSALSVCIQIKVIVRGEIHLLYIEETLNEKHSTPTKR